MNVDKTTAYYIIVTAIFLMNFSFVPLLFEILQQKYTSNIPYLTLICALLSQVLILFIVFYRSYYYHAFIYLVGFICLASIFFLKSNFDQKNTKIIKKTVTNELIYDESIYDEE